MKRLIMILITAFLGLSFISSGASAYQTVEWQTIDWRAWGSLYNYDSSTGTFETANANPFYGTTSQDLVNGVWTTPDGKEDAFGITQILNIKDSNTSQVLWEKDTTKELTIFFYGADDTKLEIVSGTTSALYTSNWKVDVYLDLNPDYDLTLGPGGRTGASDFTGVTDGELVLSLEGHTLWDNVGNSYESESFGTASTGAFTGSILLDVIDGSWKELYDTNLYAANNGTTFADMNLSFSTLANDAHSWTISGNATAQANIVPEPTTFALLGLGLIAIAGVGRRKI